jgi:hypothetical protein
MFTATTTLIAVAAFALCATAAPSPPALSWTIGSGAAGMVDGSLAVAQFNDLCSVLTLIQ